ncbi:MAG: hypothetical protein QNJ13_12990 [Paracoccaceae bacterium]|nr:hypothetical protein [Paracoccaceae bacterium]
MARIRVTAAVTALGLAALAGCAGVDEGLRDLPVGEVRSEARDYRIEAFDVLVPRTLEVSEANLFYPIADIVWRGDPFGDRYEQVEAIFDAAGDGTRAEVDGARPVRVTVQVTRFHSVTERARVTVGGVHSMRFFLTVYEQGSDAPIEGPRLVIADLPALGGEAALAAEREGQTMKVRVTEQLRLTLIDELTEPAPPPRPAG